MPILDVPLLRQPPDKGECGMACLAMIYAFFGAPKSYDELRDEMVLVPTGGMEVGGGLMMPVIGTHLQRHGFQTSMVIANPRLFNSGDIGASQSDIRKIFADHKAETKSDHDRSLLGDFENYMESGGQIDVALPSVAHIKREVDAGFPMIALGTTRFFHNTMRRMNFHFTVVTGYDETKIFANDPAPIVEGQYGRPHDVWFHGLIASSYADLDNGSLLCVRPK